MNDKKRDNIEIYAFVGVVALIIFLGYDGFVNEEMIKGGGGRSKVILGKILIGVLLKTGENYPWAYMLFRGLFLVIALWMGYKIYTLTL